ncbi:MAG: sulfur carrier protein ThiS [Phycisphaerales bacterium]|nr:MAG: sulfur carrier protein ThiS [Phycisphaerales bacterium]
MEMLKINGAEKQFPGGQMPSTLTDLLEKLDVDAATVVAEVDGKIVQRRQFASTRLQNGQSIELIRFMGGG